MFLIIAIQYFVYISQGSVVTFKVW